MYHRWAISYTDVVYWVFVAGWWCASALYLAKHSKRDIPTTTTTTTTTQRRQSDEIRLVEIYGCKTAFLCLHGIVFFRSFSLYLFFVVILMCGILYVRFETRWSLFCSYYMLSLSVSVPGKCDWSRDSTEVDKAAHKSKMRVAFTNTLWRQHRGYICFMWCALTTCDREKCEHSNLLFVGVVSL